MVSLPVIKVRVSVIMQVAADLGFFVRIFLVFFFWCIAKSNGICSFRSKLAIQEVFLEWPKQFWIRVLCAVCYVNVYWSLCFIWPFILLLAFNSLFVS
jgi:hypothetical protein